MMIIGVIILGFLIYALVGKGEVNLGDIGKSSPENLLKERYVNGEIDEEKYLKMKETLKK